MQIDMNQFLESFFDEADEHIENMEAALLELEGAPENKELLDTIFRAAHTIKGASSTFGVEAVSKFTHVMENLLDRMRNGEIGVDATTAEVLLESVDILRGLLESARDGKPDPTGVSEVVARLHEINSGSESDVVAAEEKNADEDGAENSSVINQYRVEFRPSRDFLHFGLQPTLLLRDLGELGHIDRIDLNDSALPALEQIDPESCYLSWVVMLTTEKQVSDIEDVFMFVDDETVLEVALESDQSETNDPLAESGQPALPGTEQLESEGAHANSDEDRVKSSRPIKSNPTTPTPTRESVRVDGERLDDMINQIGELVIGVSMVEEEWAANHPGTDSPAVVQLSKIVRELQERSLSLRMIPVGACFQKMARVVRDLSRKLDKQIDFQTSGEETELDKTVVDKIGDPLLHMIRNAVDHGIESEEERVAAGKPAKGKVSLTAFHKGGNIYVEITDDGKGLDLDRIKAKALERGVLSEGDSPSSQELANLIFAPGFSTAEEVTDVSGRGVGMDVVRRNVESLQGSVSVRTEHGKGSTVTVRLPLTLAILDGLTVKLGHEVLVLPLLSVVESIRPNPNDLKTIMNTGEVVMLRGEVVPLLRLHELLGIETQVLDPCSGLLVIVEEQHRKFALLVDELLGQQQVVIKNLETNFTKVLGVAGATILGNGRVAFILDVNGVCTLAKGMPGPKSERPEAAAIQA